MNEIAPNHTHSKSLFNKIRRRISFKNIYGHYDTMIKVKKDMSTLDDDIDDTRLEQLEDLVKEKDTEIL